MILQTRLTLPCLDCLYGRAVRMKWQPGGYVPTAGCRAILEARLKRAWPTHRIVPFQESKSPREKCKSW
jgi:hypothetical protein